MLPVAQSGGNPMADMYDWLSGNKAARYQQYSPDEWAVFQHLHSKLMSGAPMSPEEQMLYSTLVQNQINNQQGGLM